MEADAFVCKPWEGINSGVAVVDVRSRDKLEAMWRVFRGMRRTGGGNGGDQNVRCIRTDVHCW